MSAQERTTTSKAIGIDLGTTYSVVAGYIHGELQVIPNAEGSRTTPSTVGFNTDGSTAFGFAIETLSSTSPEQVVYDTKRMIGRSYDDPVLTEAFPKWPFKCIRVDSNNKPTKKVDKTIKDNIRICVNINGKEELYDPTFVSSRILKYLKNAAENKLGVDNIVDAIITVPAHFNDKQRGSTKLAAQIAGFTGNLRLLNEPTAAAMSYGYGKRNTTNKPDETVLVFDFGGGTFDVSILKFENAGEDAGMLATVKATTGDTFLGGVDIDNLLIEYSIAQFKLKNKLDESVVISDKSKRRLRKLAEQSKMQLSAMKTVELDLPYFHNELELKLTISRAKLDQLCAELFKRCMEKIDAALLKMGGIDVDWDLTHKYFTRKTEYISIISEQIKKVDKVLLVGGSSRIPRIQELLTEKFGSSKICQSVSPDEAVALGAAFNAAQLKNDVDMQTSSSILLLDTIPFNISIETAGGVATPIITSGSNIPTKKTQIFTTYADNQTAVTVSIFEGLRRMVKDCTELGMFQLNGIPPAPRGVPQIQITCDIDASGMLIVTAKDMQSTVENKISIENMKKSHTPEEIEKMKEEAQKFEEADSKRVKLIELKNNLENSVYQLKTQAEKSNNKSVIEFCTATQDWIDANAGTATKEELEDKLKEVTGKFSECASGAAPGAGEQPSPTTAADNKVEEVD
ncbi:Heat shock like protein [Cucumispora dikerogammari]|nr:Heat shock like protein [Cucumispora dikerogammari]